MKTKAVSMDMKIGPSNRTRPQDSEAGGGFSDILGNVSSDTRKQPGTSGSSKREPAEVKSFRGEFRYTEKASERTSDGTDQLPTGESLYTQTFRNSGKAPDEGMVDKLMSEAAELVTQTVRLTGEKPTKEQAADMLIEALKTLAPKKTESKEDEDTDTLIDSLAEILAAMTENGTIAPEATTGEENTDELVISVMPQQTAPAETTAETAAAFTKDAETAGTEIAAQEDTPEFAEFVNEAAENVPEIPTGTPMREIQAAARPIQPEMMMAAEELPEEEVIPEETIIISDTVKMLSELIENAKKELGLTEFSIEHFTAEEAPEMPEIAGNQAAIAQRMGQNDRSGELDHILNGTTRFDVSDEKPEAPKTETYDAVHMAAELMSDRMHTEMPDNEPMFPEAMHINPPEVQTAEQILDRIQNMQGDRTEFTMVLNPEALGHITVKLVAVGEKISVEINAENPDTRAILASRTESLQSMLRDGGVQLDKCQIVSEQEDTRFEQQSYEGSSKNPYGRNDEGQKQDQDGEGDNFYDLLQTI